jgi:hypothetical protein
MEPKPWVLFSFGSQAGVDQWGVFTDAYFGGRSSASWRLVPEEVGAPRPRSPQFVPRTARQGRALVPVPLTRRAGASARARTEARARARAKRARRPRRSSAAASAPRWTTTPT